MPPHLPPYACSFLRWFFVCHFWRQKPQHCILNNGTRRVATYEGRKRLRPLLESSAGDKRPERNSTENMKKLLQISPTLPSLSVVSSQSMELFYISEMSELSLLFRRFAWRDSTVEFFLAGRAGCFGLRMRSNVDLGGRRKRNNDGHVRFSTSFRQERKSRDAQNQKKIFRLSARRISRKVKTISAVQQCSLIDLPVLRNSQDKRTSEVKTKFRRTTSSLSEFLRGALRNY